MHVHGHTKVLVLKQFDKFTSRKKWIGRDSIAWLVFRPSASAKTWLVLHHAEVRWNCACNGFSLVQAWQAECCCESSIQEGMTWVGAQRAMRHKVLLVGSKACTCAGAQCALDCDELWCMDMASVARHGVKVCGQLEHIAWAGMHGCRGRQGCWHVHWHVARRVQWCLSVEMGDASLAWLVHFVSEGLSAASACVPQLSMLCQH